MNPDHDQEPSAPVGTTGAIHGPPTQGSADHNPPATGSGPPFAGPSGVSGRLYGPFTQSPSVQHPPALGSNGSQSASIRRNSAQQTTLSFERPPLEDFGDVEHTPRGLGGSQPLPPLPSEIWVRNSRIGIEPPLSPRVRSGIDYIVPIDEKVSRERTVGERLQPTLLTAKAERDRYAFKAKMTGYALNVAIGLQVLLGALTTGLSAATTGHQTSIMTAILGGLATIVASYLARARGSNEPELSITRVKDLEQFIRECEAFDMDHGHRLGDEFDTQLENLRRRFEELLGNANGERRLAPPV
ncbi:hypothetical protein D9615_008251 [Tricholomella constricta]|uniref:SMODS and SLOG-associating 2TM effector domain-containing protein n=1 Tax=Tricholomella constricta TaxID=117010 RepID=A0A8H5M038_9AGAR|nr:hypothetical protein D9615_008251 [Tricholomella constricta]